MTEHERPSGDAKGRRINGAERVELIQNLVDGYNKGLSIRALAASVDRSYGFVHRVLCEAGVSLRKRGGRRSRVSA